MANTVRRCLLVESAGLGQQQHHQRDHQQRHQAADDKRGLPVLAGKHRHDRSQRATQRNARVHDADGQPAVALADGFGAQGDEIGQRGPQTQAGHETHQQQAGKGLHVGGAQRKDPEQQHRAHEDFLAADTVSDPAAEKSAWQQPDDPGAEHPAHHFRVKGEGLAQSRSRCSGSLQVEAFDQRNDETQNDGQRRATQWIGHGEPHCCFCYVQSLFPSAG